MKAEQRIETRTKVTNADLNAQAAPKIDTNLTNLAAPPVTGGPSLTQAKFSARKQRKTDANAETSTEAAKPTNIAEAFASYIQKLLSLAEALLKKLRDGIFGKLRIKPRLILASRRARLRAQAAQRADELRALRHDDDSDVNKRRKLALRGWGPRSKN